MTFSSSPHRLALSCTSLSLQVLCHVFRLSITCVCCMLALPPCCSRSYWFDSPVLFTGRVITWPTAAIFQTQARFLLRLCVRRCWVKFYTVLWLVKTYSSETVCDETQTRRMEGARPNAPSDRLDKQCMVMQHGVELLLLLDSRETLPMNAFTEHNTRRCTNSLQTPSVARRLRRQEFGSSTRRRRQLRRSTTHPLLRFSCSPPPLFGDIFCFILCYIIPVVSIRTR